MPYRIGAVVEQVDVVAVVGACAPERQQYARHLAAASDRMLPPADRLARSLPPAQGGVAGAPWSDRPAGTTGDSPATASAIEIIGTLGAPHSATRLVGITCVVDAMHLLDDLSADDYLPTARDALGRVTDCAARALITVTQIEYASMIMLVNWEPLCTSDLSLVMALVSHLSPQARLQLQREDLLLSLENITYAPGQDRAGWVCLLNGDADPHMTDRRVSGFRSEQLRPLHPGRLKTLLDRRIETGDFGHVVRSAGFCRMATRPRDTYQWDHVGRSIAFHLAATDDGLDAENELLAVGQDLAFIGIDLDHEALTQALDEAALTDAELTAGATNWANFADPFPTWSPPQDLPN